MNTISSGAVCTEALFPVESIFFSHWLSVDMAGKLWSDREGGGGGGGGQRPWRNNPGPKGALYYVDGPSPFGFHWRCQLSPHPRCFWIHPLWHAKSSPQSCINLVSRRIRKFFYPSSVCMKWKCWLHQGMVRKQTFTPTRFFLFIFC